MSAEILVELDSPIDKLVKDALHKALDNRDERFVVHVSRAHSEVVVHIREPFERTLKFSSASGAEIVRELSGTIVEIADDATSR
jgi:hypothetical protein